MDIALLDAFRQLADQARDIKANPVRFVAHHDSRTFKVAHEYHLDSNRVCTWIYDAALAMNAAYPSGHPLREKWNAAFRRVPMLYEVDHFPTLQGIIEEAASGDHPAPGGGSNSVIMKDDELADSILRGLYEIRDETGGHLNRIALALGVNNSSQVARVGKHLANHELIDHHIPSTAGVMGYISPKAVSIIESIKEGKNIMDHLKEQEIKNNGVIIGGNNTNSPVVNNSSNARQETKITAPKGVVEKIVDWFKTVVIPMLAGGPKP